TLTSLTYPSARTISNSGGGGVVIIRADSTRGMLVRTNGSSAAIGSIRCGQSTDVATGYLNGTTDAGPGLVFNANADTLTADVGPDGIAGTGDDPFELDPASFDTMGVDIKGVRTDVFNIEGTNFVSIRNRTSGEIVNTNVGTVG